MLHELKINGLPETSNSLAWSEAGDLCVITGVKVHLYIPSRRGNLQSESQPALKPWSVVVLDVNVFTISEWPSFQQRPYADLSIGEEASESHVISCSWSAPGLAKHDRCMLGVLTANGLYSLWDAEVDLSFTTSWHRVRVLNRVIESFFASKNVESSTVPVRRYRIRAAAWAKRPKPCDQQKSFENNFVLALLNHQGEVIFLTIENAEDKQLSQPLCRIMYVLDLHIEVNLYPDGLLDELRWLDWDTVIDSANAVLLCSSEGRTWKIHTQIKSSPTGIMDMTCSFSTPVPRKSTDWNIAEAQMSTLCNPCLNFQQRQLKSAWERTKGEGYPGFTRYYGVSAYKDFQALHMSFHPRTVIEYHIQAQEISYVLFSHSSLKAPGASATKIKFDWEISATILPDNDRPAALWRMILSEVSRLQFEELLQDDLWTTCSRTIRLWLTMAILRGWQLTETLDLLRKLSNRSVDQEILDMIDEYREESSNIEALQQIEGIVDSFFKTSESLETCSICDERLKWHNERAARCQQGHVFDRCSLTLLAIQEPGISKFCGSCNREYIDKNHFLHYETPSGSQSLRMMSTLFKTFPRCVYCEGSLLNFS